MKEQICLSSHISRDAPTSAFIIYENLYTEITMAFEDPQFKLLNTCEDSSLDLIDDSFRDAWNLYVNSSYETLSEEDIAAIVFELQHKDSELYSESEKDFMDTFLEYTKSREEVSDPFEQAWQKYLMYGIDSMNGLEVAAVTTGLQEENNPNFVTRQFEKDRNKRREKERAEDQSDLPYAA